MIKSITVLGASGSVGSQVLKVLEDRNDYKLVAFSCWKNIDFVKEALNKFKTVEFVCVAYESDAEALIKESNSDVYENSILGFAGLYPSIEVLKLNKTLLLSNKESLVVGGEFINDLLNKGFGKLYPIDSEHLAISKCVYGEDFSKIDHIVLTASGGKFFNYSREELNKVTLDDGILNPNWKMGKKISVDSNTMFNKMFEIVEAHYLFKLPYEKIKVVVDRKSYVHSFVVFDDKTKLQVGKPTMIDPIIYALNFGLPKNEKNEFEDVEINTEKNYKFDEVNISRFLVLTLKKKIIEEKGSLGCVINAFDEVLVDAFLKKKIEFKDIDVIIFKILNEYKFDKKCSLNDLRKIDLDARKFALK